LAQAYEEVYYGAGGQKFSPKIERLVTFFRGRRSARVARLVPPGGAILDVGCGNGEFLDNLIKRGYRCQGVEIPGKAAQRAAAVPGLSLKIGPLREGDFAPDSFDMVTLWHVFEHLLAPVHVLRTVAAILKPNGYLILSLPNIESWQGRLFKGRWFHLEPPRHLFFLGPRELNASMHQLGFQKVASSYMSWEQNPFRIQQSLLNMIFRERDVLYAGLKGVPAQDAKGPETADFARESSLSWQSKVPGIRPSTSASKTRCASPT